MDHRTLLVIAVITLIVLGGIAIAFWDRERKRKHLRSRFGPEYQRTVLQMKDRRRAEAELEKREQRVRKLDIRPLSSADQQQFSSAWKQIQARFVDDPGDAVLRAEQLLRQLLIARGYPDTTFEQMADNVSVYHPHLVQDYRNAHQAAQRHQESRADTEELRRALVHYRALFEDLLSIRKVA